MERSLRVLDGAVMVVCAVGGVEPQTETVWRQADTYHVPRIAFINKMDRLGAHFGDAVEEIATKLGANPIPLFIPVGTEAEFSGIIDLIENKYLVYSKEDQGKTVSEAEIPPAMAGEVARWHERLIDSVSSFSDEITELYFEGAEIPAPLIRRVLKRATIERKALPVFVGSSLRTWGADPARRNHRLPALPERSGPIMGSKVKGGEGGGLLLTR